MEISRYSVGEAGLLISSMMLIPNYADEAYGEGVEKDHEEAVVWYRKAAEQGVSEAQNSLAHAYRNGEGVTQDDEHEA